MKRSFLIIIVALLLAWIISSLYFRKQYQTIEIREAVRTVKTIPVEVVAVQQKELPFTIRTSGRVQSTEEVYAVSTVSGEVKQVFVKAGASVQKGDAIAKVEDYYLAQQAKIAEEAYQQDLKDLRRLKSLSNEAITKQQLEQMELKVASSLTKVRLAKKRLNESTIKAPVSGKINQLFVVKGGMTGQGKPVCEIVGNKVRKVTSGVDKRMAQYLQAGDPVRVMDFNVIYPLRASIRSIGVSPDRFGKVPLEVVLEGDSPISNGTIVDLEMDALLSPGLYIPQASVLRAGKENFVFLVDGNLANKQTVELQRAVQNQWQVLSGIREGDVLITSGNHLVETGDSVRIMKTAR